MPRPFLVLGNIPAPRRAVAFGLTMHDGILLPGNAEPCVIPGGAVPPGQFAKSTEGATRLELGTMMLWEVRELRSEEHTSELQSRLHIVCRLLLEQKKPIVAERPEAATDAWTTGATAGPHESLSCRARRLTRD